MTREEKRNLAEWKRDAAERAAANREAIKRAGIPTRNNPNPKDRAK